MFDIAWQEFVFAIGGFVFFAALFPSILSHHKPDFKTCIITALVLTLFVFAFATMQMWVSVLGQAIIAVGWWVLTVQTFRKQVATNEQSDTISN